MIKKEDTDNISAETKETVRRIASEIIEPAMQEAVSKARKEGSAQEVLSALANCYGGLLVDTLGREAAATFIQGPAVHIASLKEEPVNS